MTELSPWPSRGNRRQLEQLWLEKLELGGGRETVVEPPTGAPRELAQALEEFNGRLFWHCHETLEGVWLATPYPLRFFYHALIKAAVGFHHLSRHNRHGARVKLSDAAQLLPLFHPRFLGVRTDLLLDDISVCLERLDGAGRLDWTQVDATPTPVIRVGQ